MRADADTQPTATPSTLATRTIDASRAADRSSHAQWSVTRSVATACASTSASDQPSPRAWTQVRLCWRRNTPSHRRTTTASSCSRGPSETGDSATGARMAPGYHPPSVSAPPSVSSVSDGASVSLAKSPNQAHA